MDTEFEVAFADTWRPILTHWHLDTVPFYSNCPKGRKDVFYEKVVVAAVVSVLFSTGLSSAQEEVAKMPKKVREFLDSLAGTWTHDGKASIIKSMWALSSGGMGTGTHCKINGKWASKHIEFGPDGTTEFTNSPTYSDDGKTWTIKSTSTLNGRELDPNVDVWHKISK